MFKDTILSLFYNFQQKSKNPFLGTYALVWLIRNWRLVYSVLYFDSRTDLNSRIKIISGFFTTNSFIGNLIINIFWTLVALIITYAFINLSRLIVNLFEKQLTPFIYKITDKNSIVLKNDYDKLKAENYYFQKKAEEERDSKVRMQNEVELLEKKIVDFKNSTLNAKTDNDSHSPISIEKTIAHRMLSKGLVLGFREILSSVSMKEEIYQSKELDFLLQNGLLVYVKKTSTGKIYELSPLGEEVRNYLIQVAN